MEVRTALADGLGILGDLAHEIFFRGIVGRLDRVEAAQTDAAAAAGALVVVDGGFVVCREDDGALGTVFGAHMAAAAEIGVNLRFTAIVLLHLSGAGT